MTLFQVVAGICAGASLVTLAKFGDTMTKCDSESTWNTTCNTTGSAGCCVNTASTDIPNGTATAEWNATISVKSGMANVSEQFPTIGIIAVMVIIIGLIAGIFSYFAFFR